jgi:glycosyltransferase involved in cell wall biosynthesis
MPKLSIITVNLNNLTGLQKTMESVFAQTFTDYEYIIIDGGSTDGSKEEIKKNENKLGYWVSEKDAGIYNAMNKGILKAKGAFLLFLNSGDYLVNGLVCSQMLPVENYKYDLIYGNIVSITKEGEKKILKIPKILTLQYILVGTPYHCSTLISKRLFNDYGLYNESLKIAADWAFFFKVIVTGNATLKHMDVEVSYFLMDGLSSLPENQELIKEERTIVIKRELPIVIKSLLEKHVQLEDRNQYLEKVLFSKRLLLKQLFLKLKIGVNNRFKLNKNK